MKKTIGQFSRFFIVGTAGFIVDACILASLTHGADFDPLMARLPAFAVAVVVTWALNRSFTFQAKHLSFKRSFPAYLSANLLGLSINFGAYTTALYAHHVFYTVPILALVIGSIAGMFFNFAAGKFWVFRRKETP